ncbi:MAG: copper resistance protein CopC [Thermomicrobiales bacterium]|nr:copper resistance protein CopC [Thermomicrobiales bacterium]
MNEDRNRSSRLGTRWLLSGIATIATVILSLGFGPGSALAHTSLISTDPTDGSLLATAPATVTFTFNEPIDPVTESFVLLDSDGTSRPLELDASGPIVRVALPGDLPEGTHVVGWRVISADGHPVSGAFTFSIGYVSETGIPTEPPSTTARSVEWVLDIAEGFAYLGLLMAAGLAIFRVLSVSAGVAPRASTWTIAAWSAGIAIVATALTLPLTVARQFGYSLQSLFTPARWTDELDTNQVNWLISLIVGLLIALLASRQATPTGTEAITLTGVAIAVISPTLSGHTNSFTPIWVFRTSNVLHVLTGSIWLGGLIGILLLLRPAKDQNDGDPGASARVVTRFSAVAGVVLAVLLATAVTSAWITLGSLNALWTTDYGRLVLIKAGLVLAASLVAAWNHFRLVPAIEKIPDRSTVWMQLRRTVATEAALLCVVALVTGFLVNQNPLESSAAGPGGPPPIAKIEVAVGDNQLTGTIDPALVGQSELTITLTDAHGEPFEAAAPPVVKMRLRATDIGPFEFETTEGESPGTYTATVQFPSTGLWDVEIPIRISRFEETTARVTVEIR